MSLTQNSSDRSIRHYELEEKTLNQLLVLENEFRAHYNFAKKELTQQMEWANRLWVLTQRYILLKSTGPGCKHPEIYPAPAEDNVLLDMTEKIKSIRNSNCRIYASVKELRKSCIIFEELCSQLDMTVESPCIMGDTFHKPLSFFIELVSDLFKYLHASTLRQRYSSHLIEPSNLDAVAKYKSVIEPSEDFEEYLTVGLTYCKCLRPKPIC